MNLSRKTRTRLVVLNASMWLVTGVTLLAVVGGPRDAFETWVEPIETELGGWFALGLAAAGWTETPLPRYEIAIEPSVFRAAALFDGASGGHESVDRWWFPARFQADGTAYPVDLQFASTGEDALHRSWRVRFRGKDSYRGARELELAPIREGAHALELMIREQAGESGLLAPPGGVALLAVNGARVGTYFWSEGSNTAMLERLGYPKGEILTPSPSAAAIPARLAADPSELAGFAHYVPALDRSGNWSVAQAKLEHLLALARSADDADFAREIPELLDVEKFLMWNALVWALAGPTANGVVPELSWYFDPVTGLLEPVVQNLTQTESATGETEMASHAERLTTRLLASPEHRARRNELLWDLVGRRGEELIHQTDTLLGENLERLARAPGALQSPRKLLEIAEFRRSSRTEMRERVRSLTSALAASQVETTPFLGNDAGTPTLTLELEPAGLVGIQLAEVRFELGSAALAESAPASVRVIAPDGGERHQEVVDPMVTGSSVTLRPAHVTIEPGVAGSRRWTVEFRLPFFGSDEWARIRSVQSIDVVYRNSVTGEALPPARLMTAEMLARTPEGNYRALFRSVDEIVAASGLPFFVAGDELVLGAGDHSLLQTLVVPRGFRLRFEPGVTLRLGPDVSVISFRGIAAEGSAERPIHIGAVDPARPWGAIAVARAPEVSKLSFVTVSGGSRTSFQGIEFDGQLSFNASAVVLADSEVYDAHDADGLSIKRGNFEVNRSQFVENGSDGIDAEWSHGSVSECLFINNHDDGLDLADSEVTVADSAFHWMGDKSISAGERSRVTVRATELSDSEIAIASKEDSRVDVRDTEFRRNRLGFSLYRSKPVFGGGSGSVTGGVFARNDQDFSVEPGSNLELHDVQREAAPTQGELIGALALRPVITRSR